MIISKSNTLPFFPTFFASYVSMHWNDLFHDKSILKLYYTVFIVEFSLFFFFQNHKMFLQLTLQQMMGNIYRNNRSIFVFTEFSFQLFLYFCFSPG